MTAKEYMGRASWAKRHVCALMEQLADLRNMRGQLTSQLGSDVHVSGGLPHSQVEDLALRIVSQEDKLMQQAAEWQGIYAEVSEVIEQVQAPRQQDTLRQQDILRRRYLMGQSWEDIAAAYRPVDTRTVYRWHGEALKEVGRALHRYE